MLATNHAMSGAIIGALLPLPVALPLAFVSHFVLDAIPHYGIDHEFRDTSGRYKLIVYSDTFIALSCAAVALLLHKWSMETCGWVAYSPDALWVWYFFKDNRSLNIETKNFFMRFHRKIQLERPWGIIPDMLAVALLLPLFVQQLLK